MHILRECPKTFISEFSQDVFRLYMWSQAHNNALPDAGGLNDQIAVVMDAMSVIRDEQCKVEAWQRHVETAKADKARQRERMQRGSRR